MSYFVQRNDVEKYLVNAAKRIEKKPYLRMQVDPYDMDVSLGEWFRT